jgi:hypothetical protein
MERNIFAVALVALFVGAGCNGPELHDDIDLELDFELTPSDELHLPYVAGATVTLSASDGDGEDDVNTLWTLATSNPAVLRIDSQTEGRARCTALSAGVTSVAIIDEDGEVIHESDIEVANPDHVIAYPHGPLIVGYPDALPAPELDVLAGGTVTLLIEYYRGDQRLYGNGALSAVSSSSMTAAPAQTFLFENREWLKLTPSQEGDHTVDLSAAGAVVGSFTVHAHGPDVVTSIEQLHDVDVDFDDVEKGDLITVLGMARTATGAPVYGVEFSWDIDGDGVPGLGDLFRYEYEEKVISVLGAEFDGLRSESKVHGRSGQVGSSNHLGCALGAGQPSRAALWLVALASVLAFVRASSGSRRRGASSSTRSSRRRCR